MRAIAIGLAVLLSAGNLPLSAQQYGPQPDSATQREILALREAAWRTWFANDQEGFRKVVPEELVALGWDGGEWGDRDYTIARMAEFANSGMTLTALEFPTNVFQQYGDAVVLYTRFRLVLTAGDGTGSETTGRGTEIFVRRNGKWIHTGWHLDTVDN
jgi:hypothetical protein